MALNAVAIPAIEKGKNGFVGVDIPNYDFITNCMHCGLCLPTCPTYALTGLERSSPRGRIRLIKSVADGDLEITPGFVDEMHFCLDCQACETACPAGVKYGSLVEAARAQIYQQGKVPWLEKGLKLLFLKNVLSSKKKLKRAAKMLRWYQRDGVQWIVNRTGIMKTFAPKMAKLQHLSPRINEIFFDDSHPEVITPEGKIERRVAFLSGCIMNVAFADVNEDTIDVLLHNGCQVIVPRLQECCGSLHAHNGDIESARKLARHNIDVFSNYEFEAIVINSAGCGAFMKDYGRTLADDPQYASKARSLSGKIKDLTEFLISIDFKKPHRPFHKRVAYHDACHLAHAQHIFAEPRTILQSLPGIDIVELPEASWCCGSAGIYNIVRYDDSIQLLNRKMKNIQTTDADIIIANNPGCLAQMRHGLDLFGVKGEIIHLATLLKRAYDSQE
jgi:glycolate oxidase iron-sulfur subunit